MSIEIDGCRRVLWLLWARCSHFGLKSVSRICGRGSGVQRVAGGGCCGRYVRIIDLDSTDFVSIICARVREVRKGQSLVDSGMVKAIAGMNRGVFTLKLFSFNECIGQRVIYATLAEPSRIIGRVSLIARVNGSIKYFVSERHQTNITPSSFGWCLSQQA